MRAIPAVVAVVTGDVAGVEEDPGAGESSGDEAGGAAWRTGGATGAAEAGSNNRYHAARLTGQTLRPSSEEK